VAIDDIKYLIKMVTNGLELAIDRINIMVEYLERILNIIKVTADSTKHLVHFVKTLVDGRYNLH